MKNHFNLMRDYFYGTQMNADKRRFFFVNQRASRSASKYKLRKRVAHWVISVYWQAAP